MTTSSDNRSPSAPNPNGTNHWQELTERLPGTVAVLDQWIDEQLEQLEDRYHDFITRTSLRKTLRRPK